MAGVRHRPDQHKALASWVVGLAVAVAVAHQRERTVVLRQMKEEGASSFLPVEGALAYLQTQKEDPLCYQEEALAPESPYPYPYPYPYPCLHLHIHWEEEAWSRTEKGEEVVRHPFPLKARLG